MAPTAQVPILLFLSISEPEMSLPLQNFDRDLGEFLASEIAEISAARNSPRLLPRFQNLVEILAEILARSQNLLAAKNSPRILPTFRRDLKISSRFLLRFWQDLRISAAKNSLRFSLRSQDLGGQTLSEILAEISKSGRPKTHRESRQDFK